MSHGDEQIANARVQEVLDRNKRRRKEKNMSLLEAVRVAEALLAEDRDRTAEGEPLLTIQQVGALAYLAEYVKQTVGGDE